MSKDKLFTVAGTATHKGVTKVRFANDLVARIKILSKAGATDVNLVELPRAMTKLEALQHLTDLIQLTNFKDSIADLDGYDAEEFGKIIYGNHLSEA